MKSVHFDADSNIYVSRDGQAPLENLIRVKNRPTSMLEVFDSRNQIDLSVVALDESGKILGISDFQPAFPETISCSFCAAQFSSSEYEIYRIHRKAHLYQKPFLCTKCHLEFNSEVNLKIHSTHHIDDASYLCPLCNASFSRISKLHSHCALHAVEETLFCSKCGKDFEFLIPLELHMEAKHLNENMERNFNEFRTPSHVCESCNVKLSSVEALRKHYRKMHLSAPDPLPKVSKRKPSCNRKYLRNSCDECGKSFQRPCQLKRHLVVHSKLKAFKCDICGKSFTQSDSLKIHSKIHDKEAAIHKCEICEQTFSQAGNLRSHIKVAHPDALGEPLEKLFSCEICCCSFRKMSSLRLHTTVKHVTPVQKNLEASQTSQPLPLQYVNTNNISSTPLPYSLSETDSLTQINKKFYVRRGKILICLMCKKDFNRTSDLVRHMRVHSGCKPFCCMHCGRLFFHKSNLRLHVESFHSGMRKQRAILTRNYQCSICNKFFINERNLNRHVEKHEATNNIVESVQLLEPLIESNGVEIPLSSNTTNFKCRLCPKGFMRLGNLRLHQRNIHKGQIPYTCTICSETFNGRDDLNRHLSSHGKSKYRHCGYCFKRFSSKSNLKRHLAIKLHSNGNFKCGYCGKCFNNRYVCRRHIQIHASAVFNNEPIDNSVNATGERSKKLPYRSCPAAPKPIENLENMVNPSICLSSYNRRTLIDTNEICTSVAFENIVPNSFSNSEKEQSNNLHRCHVCDNIYKSAAQLYAHLLSAHTEEPVTEVYECDICYSKHSSEATLNEHISKHHTQVSVVAPKQFQRPIVLSREQAADIARVILPSHASLSEKLLVRAASQVVGYYKPKPKTVKRVHCTYCPRAFAKKHDLNRHLRRHTLEKPYRCEKCDKNFALLDTYRKHLTSHRKEKNFQCHLCQKRFGWMSSLALHMRIHSGARPLKCSRCTACFRTSDQRKFHEKSCNVINLDCRETSEMPDLSLDMLDEILKF